MKMIQNDNNLEYIYQRPLKIRKCYYHLINLDFDAEVAESDIYIVDPSLWGQANPNLVNTKFV